MTPVPVCVLYTQEADLVRRVKAFLRTTAEVQHVPEAGRLDAVLQQTGPALLIMDLRAKESRDLVDQVQKEWPEVVIIALGVVESEPLREAEECGIYAAESLELDRRKFQALAGRAFGYLKVLEENRDLRQISRSTEGVEPLGRGGEAAGLAGGAASLRLLRFPRAFRQLDNVDALLTSVAESVADAAGVARLGIFSKIRHGDLYQLRAGVRCFPETYDLEFGERDALVRWFELHAHLIARANLAQTSNQEERALLRRALDTFGAEVIVPLYAGGRIIGWLFFGHQLTGQRFNYADLEAMMVLAEHVSTVLENALLYEEITVQKALAETLLKSIPPGIVATDENGIIRSFNPTAERILGLSSNEVLNEPIESAGNKLAGLVREVLGSKTNLPAQQWTDNNTRRSLSIETRWLAERHTPIGAVAVVHDVTAEQTLRDKQALVDRAAFWTDLAASMSHEIRNPLVAIKTFAQLLPERFDDPDFRKEFNNIVVREVDRLDRIITQINNFAHPPDLVFKPIDVRAPVRKAIEIARSRFGVNGDIAVETSLPNDLPQVLGDEVALAEAFAHLVANAAEALSGRSKPRITLSAKPIREGDHASGVMVTVRDNGKGITPDLKEKVFSPFCTTKPRGIGLGLPIVKRTVFDHNGWVEIDSTSHGTLVSVILPTRPAGD